jgi:hypothetical protein
MTSLFYFMQNFRDMLNYLDGIYGLNNEKNLVVNVN